MIENKRLNILMSAFRCEPGKGGEPGVGWNFAKNMTAHHNVWVLTRKDHKKLIDDELLKRPVKNLRFIYYDPYFNIINEKTLGEQLFYILWQLLALSAYRRASKVISFDIIHHLTFNQYRSPSLGFFVKKPFIMGPIGGAETISPAFFQDLSFTGKLKEVWRSIGFDIYLFSILCKLKRSPKKIVFSSMRNFEKMNKYTGDTVSQNIPAIGINEEDFSDYTKVKPADPEKPFTIIYSGTAKDWKGLLILIRALKLAFNNKKGLLVKFIGIRNEAENNKVSGWIRKYGLSDKIQLVKFLPREKLIKEMSDADVSVYPAFRDSGSMSVLEACALGCAVVCFDAGGQDAFPDDIIIKIPVFETSYQTNLINLAEKLHWCYDNPDELNRIGTKARKYVFEHFTWRQKVFTFSNMYRDLLLPGSNI